MRLIFGCMPSRSAPPPPNGSKYNLGVGGNTCQMYGISFSLLPIQGINGLAIPATPVQPLGEILHGLLQAGDCRVQTGAHFLELPDGGVQLSGVAGVKISLTAAGNGDSLAPQAVDLLPQIALAETVVLLSKGEIDSKKVRVEFSLEDMDMSGFQKGATYEQIKAYVLEHTGLKVSSLYISQIKRKCGLDVGQNYNLSKKEDAKVPKCPPEKEAAIRDALKYFQMI